MNSKPPVLIKTLFSNKTDQDDFFNISINILWEDTAWRESVQPKDSIFAGPFCYTLLEQEIPF